MGIEFGFKVYDMWASPKLCYLIGGPHNKEYSVLKFWGLYQGPLILGNYHIKFRTAPASHHFKGPKPQRHGL